jgi:hypothetical protein
MCRAGEEKQSLSSIENLSMGRQDSSKKIYVDNDEFVFRLLDKELTIDFFRKNYRLIGKKTGTNKYNNLSKDSILLFSNNQDSARFDKSKTNVILEKMSLRSKKVILDNNIRIGVSDSVFKHKFNLITVPPILVIKDFENTSFFCFYFKGHYLSKIVYTSTYID